MKKKPIGSSAMGDMVKKMPGGKGNTSYAPKIMKMGKMKK